MFDLRLPAELTAEIRAAAQDATIAAARAFGFGGSSWWVDRPSGSGTDTRVPVRQPTPVQALCFRQKPSSLAATATGDPAGDELWRVIVLDQETDIQPGDVLTSEVPSGGYAVRVDSLERWYDYARGEVSEVRYG